MSDYYPIYVSGSSKIQTLLPSNKIFSTEFTKLILKPCGEISITLDGNNVWILLEPLTYQGFIQDFCQEGANIAIVKLRGGGGGGPYCISRICWRGNLMVQQ